MDIQDLLGDKNRYSKERTYDRFSPAVRRGVGIASELEIGKLQGLIKNRELLLQREALERRGFAEAQRFILLSRNKYNNFNKYDAYSQDTSHEGFIEGSTTTDGYQIPKILVSDSDKPTEDPFLPWRIYKKNISYEAQPLAANVFPFRFHNFANGKDLVLPAYIDSFNENIAVSWNSQEFMARSEPIYIYNNTERTFSFSFWIIMDTTNEITEILDVGYPIPNLTSEYSKNPTNTFVPALNTFNNKLMWKSINYLHQCTRPSYDSNGLINRAPIITWSLGGIFTDIMVIFDSLGFSYEPLVWDMNAGVKDITPMYVKVDLSGKFIHKNVPDANYIFYNNLTRSDIDE